MSTAEQQRIRDLERENRQLRLVDRQFTVAAPSRLWVADLTHVV